MTSYKCPQCLRKDILEEKYAPYSCYRCKVVLEAYIPKENTDYKSHIILDFSKGGDGFYANDKDKIRLGTDLKQWTWTGKRWKKTI